MAKYRERKLPATPIELEKQIAEMAVECGVLLKKGRAGFAPTKESKTGSVAEEKGYSKATWPWRRLMAECVNYLSIQSLTFEGLIQRKKGDSSNFVRACWSLSTKAASDALCVLHLCDHGFIGQASIVARSCIETIEALAAFTLERELADAFVSAQSLDDANHAWFKLVRTKARRTMDAAFAEIIDMDEETKAWRHHNRRFFGAHTHPSYLAPMQNMFAEWEDGKQGYPILPARTMDCVKIYQAIADSCFEYASLLLLSVHGPQTTEGREAPQVSTAHVNCGFFEDDWLDSYASSGHKFIQRLWVFYIRHQDARPFCLWREGRPESSKE